MVEDRDEWWTEDQMIEYFATLGKGPRTRGSVRAWRTRHKGRVETKTETRARAEDVRRAIADAPGKGSPGQAKSRRKPPT